MLPFSEGIDWSRATVRMWGEELGYAAETLLSYPEEEMREQVCVGVCGMWGCSVCLCGSVGYDRCPLWWVCLLHHHIMLTCTRAPICYVFFELTTLKCKLI